VALQSVLSRKPSGSRPVSAWSPNVIALDKKTEGETEALNLDTSYAKCKLGKRHIFLCSNIRCDTSTILFPESDGFFRWTGLSVENNYSSDIQICSDSRGILRLLWSPAVN
jgi:hypothetical protein